MPERLERMGPYFEHEFPRASARATDCFINLLAVGNLAETLLGNLLRPYGLSVGSLNTLGILTGAGEPLSPHEISERLLVTRGTVTGLLDSLEKLGFVRRIPHPHDRRKLLVELTDEVASFGAANQPLLHRAEREWMAGLTDHEQETLLGLLGKLRAHLLDLGREAPTVEVADAPADS
jgi:DNA-binding MarR family transcriptional regulator